jgi:hypothetical protein
MCSRERAYTRVANAEGETVTEVFDFLSEYAHPNFWGLLDLYSETDNESGDARFLDRPFGTGERHWPRAVLGATLGLYFTVDAVEQYEASLVSFVTLCEAKIHDDGNATQLPHPRPCSAQRARAADFGRCPLPWTITRPTR